MLTFHFHFISVFFILFSFYSPNVLVFLWPSCQLSVYCRGLSLYRQFKLWLLPAFGFFFFFILSFSLAFYNSIICCYSLKYIFFRFFFRNAIIHLFLALKFLYHLPWMPFKERKKKPPRIFSIYRLRHLFLSNVLLSILLCAQKLLHPHVTTCLTYPYHGLPFLMEHNSTTPHNICL